MKRAATTKQASPCALIMFMVIMAGCNLEDTIQATVDPVADAALDLEQDTAQDAAVDEQDERPDMVKDTKDDQDTPIDLADEQPDVPLPLVPIYRINAGGPAHSDAVLDWAEDSQNSPSACLAPGISSQTTTASASIEAANSIPDIVQSTERWVVNENAEGLPDVLFYSFPVDAGQHEIDLIFSENYEASREVGARVYDVLVNDTVVVTAHDAFATLGAYKGEVITIPLVTTTNDAGITILFDRGTYGSFHPPRIQGIEIRSNQQAKVCNTRN